MDFETNYNKETVSQGLPNQMVSTKTKMTKSWQKNTVNFFISNLYNNENSIRKSKEEMRSNIRLFNNKPEPEDLKDSFDPLGLNDDNENSENLPIKDRFYNVMNNPLNTLFGEELKRRSDIRAIVVNQTAINQKDKEFQGKLFSFLQQTVREESVNEEDFKTKLQELDRFAKYDLQSAHEKMANEIIQIITNNRNLNIKQVFNTAFKSLNIIAEEIVRVGHIGNEPWLFNVDSENFHVLGLGDSSWIHEGNAWIEYEYLHPNRIIEEFGKNLTDSEIRKILESKSSLDTQYITPLTAGEISDGNVILGEGTGSVSQNNIMFTIDGNSTDTKWIDNEGKLRVVRVQWLSLRKIGELKYYDEFGDSQKKIVDEYYKPDISKGEEVEWYWINELWEATKIGSDIYVNIKPSDVQMRSINNPAKVRSHYLGVIDSTLGGKARCLVDDVRPYQEDYNIWMLKLKHLWTQHIGKVGVFDVSRIPSGMSVDEWFKWVSIFGIAFENPFEESAKGQVAGMMQQRSSIIDIDKSKEIMEAINMLQFLEGMINKIAAVPQPRQGELQGTEGLGVSQEAVVRSSTQTESRFQMHEHIKSLSYAHLIEYAKVLWKDSKFKRQLQLDDLSNYIIDIDGAVLNEAEYGVQITNSGRLYEMEHTFKQLAHAGVQSGTVTLSDVMNIQLATSPSEMKAILTQAEDKKFKQQQESQQQQIIAQQQQMEAQMQFEQVKHQQEIEKLDKEYQYKMELKRMELQDKADADAFSRYANDDNRNHIEDQIEIDKENIKKETKLAEIKSEEKMFYDGIKIKEKIEMAKIKAQQEIATKNAMKK